MYVSRPPMDSEYSVLYRESERLFVGCESGPPRVVEQLPSEMFEPLVNAGPVAEVDDGELEADEHDPYS